MYSIPLDCLQVVEAAPLSRPGGPHSRPLLMDKAGLNQSWVKITIFHLDLQDHYWWSWSFKRSITNGDHDLWSRLNFSIYYTACGHRMAHRKWKENKQQPGTTGPGNMLGSSLVSFHFLWAILCPQAVWKDQDQCSDLELCSQFCNINSTNLDL